MVKGAFFNINNVLIELNALHFIFYLSWKNRFRKNNMQICKVGCSQKNQSKKSHKQPRLQSLKIVFCFCCITSGENTSIFKFLTVFFSFDIHIFKGKG